MGQDAPAPAEAGTSIAVLPFVNMSDDKANEYFSDGISEELLNVLERVLDDRFMVNLSAGKLSDKTTVIADVLSWKMTSQTITDRTVVVDGDTAIVYGTANFRFAADGKDDEMWAGRYTTAYIKRDGRWRALALQMTELKPN